LRRHSRGPARDTWHGEVGGWGRSAGGADVSRRSWSRCGARRQQLRRGERG
jgi:hypothetical protein